jgi:hypothetical protein
VESFTSTMSQLREAGLAVNTDMSALVFKGNTEVRCSWPPAAARQVVRVAAGVLHPVLLSSQLRPLTLQPTVDQPTTCRWRWMMKPLPSASP